MISSSGTSSKPLSVSMPFRYLIGFPLGSWIMRNAMVPSIEVAGNILTGTRTRERRRLPDQTGMGAIGRTLRTLLNPSNLGQPVPTTSEQKVDSLTPRWRVPLCVMHETDFCPLTLLDP